VWKANIEEEKRRISTILQRSRKKEKEKVSLRKGEENV